MSDTDVSLDDAYAEPETKVAETEVVEATTETESVESEKSETTEETAKAEDSTTESKETWTFSQAMDEREKRQEAVRRMDVAEAQLAELTKADDISVLDDEQGFREQLRADSRRDLNNSMMNMSQAYAERELGKDKVDEAVAWFKDAAAKSPYLMARFSSSSLQFHEVVDMFNEEKIRSNPDAYKAEIRAEILAEQKNVKEDESEPITPSLASKRSSGKQSTIPEDYEDILGD